MTDSPLSDVMTAHAETGSPESYDRFVALFRTSIVGITSSGTAEQDSQGRHTAGGNFGAGKTTHGDGKPRILAYADPETALRNFGPRFNAGVVGEVLLQMAASDPDCEGILINSAITEISLVISKATAQSLLSAPAAQAPARRPWWKRHSQ